MKKTMCLILAFLIMLVAFTGCGSETSTNKNNTGTTKAATTGAQGDVLEGDWKYIKEKGELILGMTYFAPMNYLDDDGNLIGFETEFAKAVCEKLGVTAKFVEIDWDSKETELKAKNIDCIWNGMTIDDQRKANMEITIPYMRNKQVMVALADNAESLKTAEAVSGKYIVAELGSAGESLAEEDDFFKDANFTAVDTQAKALMEVKAKTADAAIIDYVMSIGSIGAGTDYADVVVVPNDGLAPEEYGEAIRKGSNVVEKVNEAMQALANEGKLKTIAETYKLEELLLVQPK